MPSDTAALFAARAKDFDSRSLVLDRFVYDLKEPKMDEARRLHFSRVCEDSFKLLQDTRSGWERESRETRDEDERRKLAAFLNDTATLAKRMSVIGPAEARKAASSRQNFLRLVASAGTTFHAQLQSRLMVNMAGGVMENAGLCLDRFGLPLIPGSAVKGCARRAATQALVDAESADDKAEVLFNLALIFGWGDTDWKAGRRRKREAGREVETGPHSDFWWAMTLETGDRAEDDAKRNQFWRSVALTVADRLLDYLGVSKREYPSEPWRDLPNFAGSVSFLPAYPVDLGKIGKAEGLPVEVPPLGKLELDVVTCHHGEYYRGNPAYASAPDTEEPVPVIFPAVAPGHVFTFALAKLRNCSADDLQHARTWLKTGLETFGLGAKTNAGYGWFGCSDDLQTAAAKLIQHELERLRKAEEKAEQTRKEAEANAAAERAEKERLAKASPHEKAEAEFTKLGDEPFAVQARKYAEMDDVQRHGFVLALKARRDTVKRWAKKKPELLKPWQDHAQKLQPPILLP
jgi:CRISPR/Cas system CMR subunit Cmr6 (Cas7 group RAMP superfamily)